MRASLIASSFLCVFVVFCSATPLPAEEDEGDSEKKEEQPQAQPQPFPFMWKPPPMPMSMPFMPVYQYPKPDPKTGYKPPGIIASLPPRTPPGLERERAKQAANKGNPKKQDEEDDSEKKEESNANESQSRINKKAPTSGTEGQSYSSSFGSSSSYSSSNGEPPVIHDKGYIVVKESGPKGVMRKYKYGDEGQNK